MPKNHFDTGHRFTHYLHENSDEPAGFWPAGDSRQDFYRYAFYEVALDAEVDLDTGAVVIHGVDGVPLERPVPA